MSLLASAGTVLAAGSSALVDASGAPTPLGIFASEFFGTFILILLGAGVCAAVTLKKSYAKDAGWVVITFGWGLAVFTAVYLSFLSGAHLSPAVTVGLATAGRDLATGVPATAGNIALYIVAQMLGAMAGATAAYLTYKKHFDEDCDPALKLGVFSTGPEIRSYGWNCLTEAIGTAVLILWVFVSGYTETAVGPLGVALIIVVIGNSLGGPTGYAINPARDLGPRIAYTFLPIPGKTGSNWSYAWVPVVGPIIGAILAGLIVPAVLPL